MAGAGVGLSMAGSEPTSLVGNRADLFGWSQSRPLWLEPEPTSLVGAGADLFGWSRSRPIWLEPKSISFGWNWRRHFDATPALCL